MRERPLDRRRVGVNATDFAFSRGQEVIAGRVKYRRWFNALWEARELKQLVPIRSFAESSEARDAAGLSLDPGFLTRRGGFEIVRDPARALPTLDVALYSPRAVPHFSETWRNEDQPYSMLEVGGVVMNAFKKEVRGQLEKALRENPGRNLRFSLTGKLAQSERVRDELASFVRDLVAVTYTKQYGHDLGDITLGDLYTEDPKDTEATHSLLLVRGASPIEADRSSAEKVDRSQIAIQISYPQPDLSILPEDFARAIGGTYSPGLPSLPMTRRMAEDPRNHRAWARLMKRIQGESYAELTRLGRIEDIEELPVAVKAAFYLRLFELAEKGPRPVRYLIGAMPPLNREKLGSLLGYEPVASIYMAADVGQPPKRQLLAVIDLRSPAYLELKRRYAELAAGVSRPELYGPGSAYLPAR
jgi:hypothetical protein